MTAERDIQREILLALGRMERVRAFRLNVGFAKDRRGRGVRFGVPGMADILVLVGPRYLWLEVKIPSGRQSPEQRAFESMVSELGGAYRLVRSVEEALRAVEEMARGS